MQDLTDQPPGAGYTFMGRNVLARVHRDVVASLPRGAGLRSIDPFADQLRDALADLAKTESPRIVVMSGGVEHPSFVGQAYLASRLGLNLAEGADLVVRRRRLWLRSLAGLEPIDVLHRRLEGDRIDPMEVNAQGHGGVPGLLDAVRAGGVRLANAHGTGVLEDPVLAEAWDEAGDWISDRHRRVGDAEPLRRVSAERRSHIDFELAPCLVGQEVVYRPVVLRMQLVASDRKIEVMQGASARVLNPGDDPNVPTAATAKDVWVIGGTVAPPVAGAPRAAAAGRPHRVGADSCRRGAVLGRPCARARRARRTVARSRARTHDRRDRHRHGRAVGGSVERDAHARSRGCRRDGSRHRRLDGRRRAR